MEDFQANFTRIEICMLTPDSVLEPDERKSWKIRREKCRWQTDASAGGCRNFIETFHINPQIRYCIISYSMPCVEQQESTTLDLRPLKSLLSRSLNVLRSLPQKRHFTSHCLFSYKVWFLFKSVEATGEQPNSKKKNNNKLTLLRYFLIIVSSITSRH